MAKRLALRADVAGGAGTPGGVARELNILPDEAFSVWLGIASHWIGLARWGDRASDGHALLTAHLMTVHVDGDGDGGGEAGPLVSEANGPASRSFGALGPFDDAELASTSYGRTFVALRRIVRGRGSAVVGRRGVRRVL